MGSTPVLIELLAGVWVLDFSLNDDTDFALPSGKMFFQNYATIPIKYTSIPEFTYFKRTNPNDKYFSEITQCSSFLSPC